MSLNMEPEYFAKQEVFTKAKTGTSAFSGPLQAFKSSEKRVPHTYARLPYFPGVADRIAKFNPEARFIYVMRDPVERSISQYWFRVRFSGERREMLTAMREEPRYLDAGNYAMQLEPYRQLFGLERIATLTFEELSSNPLQTVRRIFRWLGVDPSFTPPNLGQRENVTPSTIAIRTGNQFNQLLQMPLVRRLKRLIPREAVSFANTWLGRAEYVNRNTCEREKVIAFLRPIQRAQVVALTNVLSREFPEWTTLNATRGDDDSSAFLRQPL